ncbi:MAG: sugar phosphate isomerase/epimerase [Bryobacteraceae bacterium]
MTRRQLLSLAAAAPARPAVRLSIGNYGMQGYAVDHALALIRAIGYDGAELCLMRGWPSEPAMLDAAARRRIREQPLPVPTLLENLNLVVSEDDHAGALDRIRAAAALAHDVAPNDPPILQTVLGGAGRSWNDVKDRMAARLADWARVAHENRIRLAVKSHFASASDTPEKLLWLLDRVRNPALSAIYDYGHFQLLGLDLGATLDALLPRASFVTVKDSRLAAGNKAQFLLPGDGTIDYPDYFRRLKTANYQGWILAEVSRQLQTAPGYDAEAAARRSYRAMSQALRTAGLRAV